MKNPRCALLALLASLCLTASASTRAESAEGRWLLDFDRQDGRVQLTMKRTTSHGHSNNSSSYSVEDFRGLSLPARGGTVAARFEMARDAGTIRFEGQLDESGGSGRFQFAANPDFEAFWRAGGYGALSADEAYAFTMHDVSRKFLDDLRSLGYERLPAESLISMRIHGATAEFIRDLKSLGYDHVPVDGLVSMRIHGATPEFVRDLKSLGYDRVPVDGLVSMRIHGATPEFVRDLKSLGYDHIPVDSLVSMRIHGVSPDYVRRLQELGFHHIPVDSLVSMRIHAVSIEYAKSMKERYGDISADELVNRRIHGGR